MTHSPHIRTRPSTRLASTAARALTVGAYALIIAAVALAWSARTSGLAIGATLEAASQDGGLTSAARTSGQAATLYFIFQKEDCSDILATAAIWNALYATHRVSVVGILVDPPSDSTGISEIVRGAALAFPVVPGRSRHILESINRLGFYQTPVAVFVDEHGRVLLTAPGASVGAAGAVRAILAGSLR